MHGQTSSGFLNSFDPFGSPECARQTMCPISLITKGCEIGKICRNVQSFHSLCLCNLLRYAESYSLKHPATTICEPHAGKGGEKAKDTRCRRRVRLLNHEGG